MQIFTRKEFIASNFFLVTVANRFACHLLKERLLYLTLLLFVQLSLTAQHRVYKSKIDPVFQFMLDHPRVVNDQLPVQEKFQPRFQVQATEGFITKNTPPEKRYECIVYTSNAKRSEER